MASIGAVRGMIMGDRDPAAALAQARRDHLKAYVAGPQGTTPWWHWPVFGVGVGVIAAASLLPGVFASILIALAMAVIAGGMSRIRIARHGAAPRFRGMPAPLRGLLVGFWAVTALLVGGAAMIAQIVNDPLWQYLILVTLTAVIVGVGGWHTERRYLAEARRLADAAGIDT